ncbi:MAG: beta-lactamase family protein [Candidatus Eisenbacteria bacterium]|nr:beta-lactamase family protein [Candidatus Eisenbacteria bacterium]MCC7143955.1 beta-lactamase family protein [Candidatus Eisenbacteria bacterium]
MARFEARTAQHTPSPSGFTGLGSSPRARAWAVLSIFAGLALSFGLLVPETHAMLPPGGVAAPAAERIDTFMSRCTDGGLSGSLLVELGGEVILHRGYGVLDRGTGRTAEADTPYHLGSLGKQFTATAILLLEEDGKLSTSDLLSRYLPDVPPDKAGITLDHLLHHTSGLPYLPQGDLAANLPMETAAREILAYPLVSAPGAQYGYSSPGYTLLAAVIEQVSGQDYDSFLRARIFEPAGMAHTGSDQDTVRWVGDLRTPSYTGSGVDDPIYPAVGWSRFRGAGSVVSTAGDLWRWEQALRSHRVLGPAATEKLFAPAVAVGPNIEHACGWNVAQSARGTTVIMHAGDLGGFNVDMRRLVDEHATIIFLSNARSGGRGYREAVSIAVTRLLFGPEPEFPPARVILNEETRRAWNTRWALPGGVAGADSIRARVDGDVVWLQPIGQAAISAVAGGDSSAMVAEAQLSALARDVVPILLSGNLAELSPLVHPSIPASLHIELINFWEATADSLGTPVETELLGTAWSPPSGGKTLLRIRGARATQLLSIDWVGGKLLNSEPVPGGAFELPFFAVSPDRVARFDLWAGRTTYIGRPRGASGG